MMQRTAQAVRLSYASILALAVLCFALCAFTGFPALPSSQPADMDVSHLWEAVSVFPVMLFCSFTLVVSSAILYFGAAMRRSVPEEDRLIRACITFGVFVLDCGVWLFTDSKLRLMLTGCVDAAALLSFMAFLMMPVLLADSINLLYPSTVFQTMRWLFLANFACFLLLVMVKAPSWGYLVSLAVHHVLTLIVCFFVIISSVRDRKRQKRIAPGMLLFFCFAALSVVMFLLSDSDIYAVFLSLGLVCLICSLIRLFLNRMAAFYKNQLRADFYMNLAYTDALSGLLNRNAFQRDQQALADAPVLCYVILDVNNLKWTNDHYGHQAGDGIICTAAGLIQEAFCAIGQCYRIGGDEFAVIAAGQEDPAIMAALRSLQRALARHNHGSDRNARLSLAYGYALRHTTDTDTEELFSRADRAMYSCKQEQKAGQKKASAPENR